MSGYMGSNGDSSNGCPIYYDQQALQYQSHPNFPSEYHDNTAAYHNNEDLFGSAMAPAGTRPTTGKFKPRKELSNLERQLQEGRENKQSKFNFDSHVGGTSTSIGTGSYPNASHSPASSGFPQNIGYGHVQQTGPTNSNPALQNSAGFSEAEQDFGNVLQSIETPTSQFISEYEHPASSAPNGHYVANNPSVQPQARDGQTFIQTLDFEVARQMTSRDCINFITGPVASNLTQEERKEIHENLAFDTSTITLQQLASMGHAELDAIASIPSVDQLLTEFQYCPEVEGETLDAILPAVYKDLAKYPTSLEYYQTPEARPEREYDENGEEKIKKKKKKLTPAQLAAKNNCQDDVDADADNTNADDELETKYLPIKVHYGPYKYHFKTSEQARQHRKKIRFPPKRAHGVDRVKKEGRYYWTKRLYEAMINVDLVFDNRTSNVAARFTKKRHFHQVDLEATAHAIFDECIAVHERGWNNYVYHYKDPKRGKLLDTTAGNVEARLERICGILKHNKASANDCIDGGITLAQLCHNPIERADTKTANNLGNKDRAKRLEKSKTKGQLEKEKKQAENKKKAEMRARGELPEEGAQPTAENVDQTAEGNEVPEDAVNAPTEQEEDPNADLYCDPDH